MCWPADRDPWMTRGAAEVVDGRAQARRGSRWRPLAGRLGEGPEAIRRGAASRSDRAPRCSRDMRQSRLPSISRCDRRQLAVALDLPFWIWAGFSPRGQGMRCTRRQASSAAAPPLARRRADHPGFRYGGRLRLSSMRALGFHARPRQSRAAAQPFSPGSLPVRRAQRVQDVGEEMVGRGPALGVAGERLPGERVSPGRASPSSSRTPHASQAQECLGCRPPRVDSGHSRRKSASIASTAPSGVGEASSPSVGTCAAASPIGLDPNRSRRPAPASGGCLDRALRCHRSRISRRKANRRVSSGASARSNDQRLYLRRRTRPRHETVAACRHSAAATSAADRVLGVLGHVRVSRCKGAGPEVREGRQLGPAPVASRRPFRHRIEKGPG